MGEVRQTMNCHTVNAALPNLLFEPELVPAEVHQHLEACPACREQLDGMKSTMDVLDSWTAPEISPYFDMRMQARLRAAKEEAPEGWWERLRARVLFATNVPVRAMAAAALGLVVVAGGGSALYELHTVTQPPQVQASATVRDLQSLDGNAQVFQQLNALDTDEADSGSSN